MSRIAPPRVTAVWTAVAAMGFSAGFVVAQSDRSAERVGPGALDTLLASIDSDDFGTRESASSLLESNEFISIADIEDRLARGRLTAEQRARLDSSARRRFGAVPRAGLGVQFGAPRRDDGVELGAVLPNFPASGVLLAGDVVIEIDGVRVRDTAQMGSFILSHRPGETLRMVIDRTVVAPFPELEPEPADANPDAPADAQEVPPPGAARVERLTLDVPLGSYDDLNTGAPLTPDRIEAAYRRYQFRKGLLATDEPTGDIRTAGTGLTPLEWLRAEGYDHTAPTAPSGSFEAVSAWRHARFAGQPGSWIARIDLRRGDPSAMARRVIRGLQADGIYDKLEEALAGYRAMLDRVTEIDRQMSPTNSSPVPDAARFVRLKNERDELVAGLNELAAEMEAPAVPASSGVEIDPTP